MRGLLLNWVCQTNSRLAKRKKGVCNVILKNIQDFQFNSLFPWSDSKRQVHKRKYAHVGKAHNENTLTSCYARSPYCGWNYTSIIHSGDQSDYYCIYLHGKIKLILQNEEIGHITLGFFLVLECC